MPTYVLTAIRLALSAGSDFCFAATFLITWFAPYTFGEKAVSNLMFVMLIEFVVVLTTGFLGGIASQDDTKRNRLFMYVMIGGVCTLFAGGFAWAFGAAWPFFAFLLLVAGKFSQVVLQPPDFDGQFRLMATWAAMTVLYLSGTFLSVGMEWPEFGVTAEVVAAQGFETGGEWMEHPHTVLVFGAYYFTGLGLLALLNELFALRRDANKSAQ
jgi:hypothetical protein